MGMTGTANRVLLTPCNGFIQSWRRGLPALPPARLLRVDNPHPDIPLLQRGLFSSIRGAVNQSAAYALAHATAIHQGGGKSKPDTTIVIHGHSLLWVTPAEGFNPLTLAKYVAGKGKLVIPGLWDMHSHFRDANPI